MQKGKAKGKDMQSVIQNAFTQNSCSLGSLSSLYDYTPSDLPEIFEEFRKSYRKHQAKKKGGSQALYLGLGSNNFGDQQISIISQQDLPNLQQLSLHENNIGPTSCIFLSEARWRRSIQYLYLGQNQISDKGCKYLSRAEWELLRIIDLSQNQIGEKGCQHLSKTIWPELTNLILGHNKIGDRGIEQFFRKRNWFLEYFTMSDCGITELACRILGRRGISFAELSCTHNKMGEMGFNFIAGECEDDALFAVIYCDSQYHKQGFCCED